MPGISSSSIQEKKKKNSKEKKESIINNKIILKKRNSNEKINIKFLIIKTQPNVFKMAWTSLEEEAMEVIGKYMRVMRLERKRELSELYARLIFPRQGQD